MFHYQNSGLRLTTVQNFFIAHALLRFDILGDIYWDDLDRRYHGRDPEGRVKSFYEAQATKDLVEVVKRKLQELEIYKKELADRGIEMDQPKELLPTLSPDNTRRLAAFLKSIDKDEKSTEYAVLRSCQSSSSSFIHPPPLSWYNSQYLSTLSSVIVCVTALLALSYAIAWHR